MLANAPCLADHSTNFCSFTQYRLISVINQGKEHQSPSYKASQSKCTGPGWRLRWLLSLCSLQEEADRELAMSLSRNMGQMHDGEDDFLRGMNSFMSPGPRQPEAAPQGSPSAEASTPSAGARPAPSESRLSGLDQRERADMERLRVRRQTRFQLGQDRHITSPILLRLSPGEEHGWYCTELIGMVLISRDQAEPGQDMTLLKWSLYD